MKMEVVIKGHGVNESDDFYRDVIRAVLNQVEQKWLDKVNLTFQCQPNPDKPFLVTVCHPTTRNIVDVHLLEKIATAIVGIGRDVIFQVIQNKDLVIERRPTGLIVMLTT